MNPNRSKKSFNNREPDTNNIYINEVLQNWLRLLPKTTIPISINESKMIYRMTLGSIYYDNGIKITEAKESETDIGKQTKEYLRTRHQTLWRKWLIIKNETNNHLNNVIELWKQHIINPVDNILFNLKRKFPTLVKYKNMQDKNEFYSEENILEGVFLEIQHYAALGYKLNYFKTNSNKVGNGYTFLMSSNKHLLEQFVSSINKIINDEDTLNKFKYLEIKKSDIETKVYEFKKELDRIYYRL